MNRERSIAALAVALFVVSVAAPASAQSGEVEQIGDQGSSTAVGQITSDDGSVDRRLPEQPTRPDVAPQHSPQISAVGDGREATSQLSREAGTASPPAQLYRGGQTAQPSTALSSPSEGRTSTVARVGGDDRCDPATPGSGEQRRLCARVIETRSAEFDRPEVKLSAEQRLLVDQQIGDQPFSAEGAARRLAGNSGDPNSLEEQGIASLVLADPQPTAQPTTEEAPTDQTTTIIEAIVGSMSGSPPSP